MDKSLQESIGVHFKSVGNTYSKPYPSYFGYMKAPGGQRVPDFYKFSGEDNKTTMGHIY